MPWQSFNWIILWISVVLFTIPGCDQMETQKKKADLLLFNGTIYTVDEEMSVASAMVVSDGKILDIGGNEAMQARYAPLVSIDLEQHAVYPGFMDPHCHFTGYGKALSYVNLVGTRSFQEIIDRLTAYRDAHPGTDWILGRGWDQNDWKVKRFPTKDQLDEVFPDHPVYLMRIDGHAVLANQAALDRIGIDDRLDFNPYLLLKHHGQLTGILIDEAMEINAPHVPESAYSSDRKALMDAQARCLAVGLTSVTDCGLPRSSIESIDSLQHSGDLVINVHAMISGSDAASMKHYMAKGPHRTDKLTVNAIKYYADGALGSRGACLLEPYHDEPGNKGAIIGDTAYFEEAFTAAFEAGFQVCTHAIGDSANRFVLDLYSKMLPEDNDRRWRIEHAQIVHPDDIDKFGTYKIIPSVQSTHATSDMYWADERLGPDRISTAYAYKALMMQNGIIANGSDFPVEDINPLFGFYAAVSRRDQNGYPEAGFQKENALTREQALKAMTIWAAYADFDERSRGSLEKGKKADFVILEEDIMQIAEQDIPAARVLNTYIDGQMVFQAQP